MGSGVWRLYLMISDDGNLGPTENGMQFVSPHPQMAS